MLCARTITLPSPIGIVKSRLEDFLKVFYISPHGEHKPCGISSQSPAQKLDIQENRCTDRRDLTLHVEIGVKPQTNI